MGDAVRVGRARHGVAWQRTPAARMLGVRSARGAFTHAARHAARHAAAANRTRARACSISWRYGHAALPAATMPA
jgi:hypothetical protein